MREEPGCDDDIPIRPGFLAEVQRLIRERNQDEVAPISEHAETDGSGEVAAPTAAAVRRPIQRR